MAYLDMGKGYPWFIFPTFLTAGFLAIHWSYHFYPSSLLRLHIYVFANVQCFFVFMWAANGMGLPWFIFPLAGWGGLLGIHALLERRKVPKIIVSNPTEVIIDTGIPQTYNQEVQIGNLDEITVPSEQPIQEDKVDTGRSEQIPQPTPLTVTLPTPSAFTKPIEVEITSTEPEHTDFIQSTNKNAPQSLFSK